VAAEAYDLVPAEITAALALEVEAQSSSKPAVATV
jgi:hypothetical protein